MAHDRTARAALRGAKPGSMYRLLRQGAAQAYRTARDQGLRAAKAQLEGQARSVGNSPRLSTAIVAGRAAFLACDDEAVERLLADLEQRFPHSAPAYELRADLLAFRGDYTAAFQQVNRARLVEPSRPSAVSRVVRMAYAAGDAQADSIAVDAVRLMPLDSAVLWAAAKGCSTPEQYERIHGAWQQSVPDSRRLPDAVRQLAAAAARAGLSEAASDHYRDAIGILHEWPGRYNGVPAKELRGKGAWGAVEDLLDVLDTAGIPFFFAAGTALGLIREGRPLDLDGDIDVGVFDSDWDRDALRELFRKDSRFDLEPNPMSRKVALKHRGGSPVDIFPFYAEDGKIWHDGVFVRWWNSPFAVERHEIRGLELPLPGDADRYLTENYGDWRTPNPGYDVFTEAPNYELRWMEYGRMHLLRRAFTSLSAGNRAAALADLESAEENDLVKLLNGAKPSTPAATAVQQAQSTRSSRTEPPAVDAIVAHAREHIVHNDDREAAIGELARAIRDSGWTDDVLWTEMADLTASNTSYKVVRQLWFESPRECSERVPIMRAVAKAASAAADHETAQLLLQKAIFVAVGRSRRLDAETRRAVVSLVSPFGVRDGGPAGSLTASSSSSGQDDGTDQEGTVTALLLALLDSIHGNRADEVQRVATLMSTSDGGVLPDARGSWRKQTTLGDG